MGHPHKKINGQLLQMDKTFSDLKMRQRDKIANWVYEAYKRYYDVKHREPDDAGDECIVREVLERIKDAGIWIPDVEIYYHYERKKAHLRTRRKNEEHRSG